MNSTRIVNNALYCFVFLWTLAANASSSLKNGFNLKDSLIRTSEIYQGGPTKDGIPSIDHPSFISAKKALKDYPDNDRAIVVENNGEIKAYPISILNWHEIVNDTIGGMSVVITFCPLCGTGIVFQAKIGKEKLSFGVSGLLYQSDVLLYDRQSNSLWSQLLTKAISGKFRGKKLVVISSAHVHLKDYLKKHPKSLVLSRKTGHSRDYDHTPYAGYEKSRQLYFPIKVQDSKMHPKTWAILLKYNHEAKIITMKTVGEKKDYVVKIGKKTITIKADRKKRQLICPKERGLVCMTGFYFALKTFYPQAEIE